MYAFVHPKTGETYWWILPYVNTELFNRVLADFAREFELGQNKHVLLAVDQAGWHVSKDARSSTRITFNTFTLSRNPNCNSSVRLWTLVEEPIANRSSEYKAQQSCERGFAFLKDPLFFADSIFLKSPERIEALAMIRVYTCWFIPWLNVKLEPHSESLNQQ